MRRSVAAAGARRLHVRRVRRVASDGAPLGAPRVRRMRRAAVAGAPRVRVRHVRRAAADRVCRVAADERYMSACDSCFDKRASDFER